MDVDFSSLFNRAAAAPTRAGGTPGDVRKHKRKQDLAPAPEQRAAASDVRAASSAVASPGAGVKKRKKKKQHAMGDAAELPVAPPMAALTGPSAAPPRRSSPASKLKDQLAGARFRNINEQLYTQDSAHAVALFGAQPELYHAYHEGFRLQARGWPLRPVDAIVDWLASQPRAWVVADIGCGDAEISERVPQKVLCFDLVAGKPHVTACDAAALPLNDGVLDAAIFCLALMGSNYIQFLTEAHRALKPNGMLKIAEVRSRFESVDAWLGMMTNSLGFELVARDESNTHFLLFLFRKGAATPAPVEAVPLKPCLYKRR
jgi:ribosomal RNA-processing protein 8